MPAVREVVRSSAEEDYRFSAVVMGIVQSDPFTLRELADDESGEITARAAGGD
jgi:hypothetical protein